MKEEIARVLTMVQEGKIDAEKGSELIQVLQDKDDAGNKLLDKPAKYLDKTLKVRIVSTENDNVTVNLPIKLVKVFNGWSQHRSEYPSIRKICEGFRYQSYYGSY